MYEYLKRRPLTPSPLKRTPLAPSKEPPRPATPLATANVDKWSYDFARQTNTHQWKVN